LTASVVDTQCLSFIAPEIINGEEYEYSADIWSLGCTVIHFLVGAPPFAELNAVAALFKMAEQVVKRRRKVFILDSLEWLQTDPANTREYHPRMQTFLRVLLGANEQKGFILLVFLSRRGSQISIQRPTAAQLLTFPFITRHVVKPEDENLLFLFNNPASI